MVRVSVMYPSGEGKKFDHDYYVNKHMTLVRERWGSMGLQKIEVDRGLAGGAPGAPAPYAAVGHVFFGSMEQFQKAAAAHGKELFADVPNFTNITPQMQIAEVIHSS
ncbi:MAG: EthD family reductase [Candidatus Rokubacteria bacterium]|nr:EthD family reductase [Candidatus Rokubacteria bacterium]